MAVRTRPGRVDLVEFYSLTGQNTAPDAVANQLITITAKKRLQTLPDGETAVVGGTYPSGGQRSRTDANGRALFNLLVSSDVSPPLETTAAWPGVTGDFYVPPLSEDPETPISIVKLMLANAPAPAGGLPSPASGATWYFQRTQPPAAGPDHDVWIDTSTRPLGFYLRLANAWVAAGESAGLVLAGSPPLGPAVDATAGTAHTAMRSDARPAWVDPDWDKAAGAVGYIANKPEILDRDAVDDAVAAKNTARGGPAIQSLIDSLFDKQTGQTGRDLLIDANGLDEGHSLNAHWVAEAGKYYVLTMGHFYDTVFTGDELRAVSVGTAGSQLPEPIYFRVHPSAPGGVESDTEFGLGRDSSYSPLIEFDTAGAYAGIAWLEITPRSASAVASLADLTDWPTGGTPGEVVSPASGGGFEWISGSGLDSTPERVSAPPAAPEDLAEFVLTGGTSPSSFTIIPALLSPGGHQGDLGRRGWIPGEGGTIDVTGHGVPGLAGVVDNECYFSSRAFVPTAMTVNGTVYPLNYSPTGQPFVGEIPGDTAVYVYDLSNGASLPAGNWTGVTFTDGSTTYPLAATRPDGDYVGRHGAFLPDKYTAPKVSNLDHPILIPALERHPGGPLPMRVVFPVRTDNSDPYSLNDPIPGSGITRAESYDGVYNIASLRNKWAIVIPLADAIEGNLKVRLIVGSSATDIRRYPLTRYSNPGVGVAVFVTATEVATVDKVLSGSRTKWIAVETDDGRWTPGTPDVMAPATIDAAALRQTVGATIKVQALPAPGTPGLQRGQQYELLESQTIANPGVLRPETSTDTSTDVVGYDPTNDLGSSDPAAVGVSLFSYGARTGNAAINAHRTYLVLSPTYAKTPRTVELGFRSYTLTPVAGLAHWYELSGTHGAEMVPDEPTAWNLAHTDGTKLFPDVALIAPSVYIYDLRWIPASDVLSAASIGAFIQPQAAAGNTDIWPAAKLRWRGTAAEWAALSQTFRESVIGIVRG